MKKSVIFTLKNEKRQFSTDECIAVTKISMNAFEVLSDIEESGERLNWFDEIEKNAARCMASQLRPRES